LLCVSAGAAHYFPDEVNRVVALLCRVGSDLGKEVVQGIVEFPLRLALGTRPGSPREEVRIPRGAEAELVQIANAGVTALAAAELDSGDVTEFDHAS
jgi:hypothetical protein